MAESALRNISPTWWKDIKAPPEQTPFGQAVSDILGGVSLVTSPFPVIGDVAGLASDAAMYAANPEERNWKNAAFTLAGLLPFVQGLAVLKLPRMWLKVLWICPKLQECRGQQSRGLQLMLTRAHIPMTKKQAHNMDFAITNGSKLKTLARFLRR